MFTTVVLDNEVHGEKTHPLSGIQLNDCKAVMVPLLLCQNVTPRLRLPSSASRLWCGLLWGAAALAW